MRLKRISQLRQCQFVDAHEIIDDLLCCRRDFFNRGGILHKLCRHRVLPLDRVVKFRFQRITLRHQRRDFLLGCSCRPLDPRRRSGEGVDLFGKRHKRLAVHIRDRIKPVHRLKEEHHRNAKPDRRTKQKEHARRHQRRARPARTGNKLVHLLAQALYLHRRVCSRTRRRKRNLDTLVDFGFRRLRLLHHRLDLHRFGRLLRFRWLLLGFTHHYPPEGPLGMGACTRLRHGWPELDNTSCHGKRRDRKPNDAQE